MGCQPSEHISHLLDTEKLSSTFFYVKCFHYISQAETSWHLIHLLILTVPCIIASGICFNELDLCPRCDGTSAICTTTEPDLVIPENLSPHLKELVITYEGTAAEITPKLLSPYPELVYLSITGNISTITRESFKGLRYLKNLTIARTLVSSLPPDLFHPNNTLLNLDLGYNSLTKIPSNLFQGLKHLNELNLGNNKIRHWNCSSIGPEFRHLKNLTTLNLANLLMPTNSCSTEASLFAPIQDTVTNLNLSSGDVFMGNQKIFQNLSRLKVLDISHANGYNGCPDAGRDLFWNLPHSLETLIMRHWITLYVTFGCPLTNVSLEGLKQLPNLREIDFKYGDLAFGSDLEDNVFDNFMALEKLDLGWCRLSGVANYAFDQCPKLKWISFEGNPLGYRHFQLYRDEHYAFCKVKYLSLSQTTAFAPISQDFAVHFMLRACKIEHIDISGNQLTVIPKFNTAAVRYGNYLQTILLDDNVIQDLYFSSGENFNTYCYFLRRLTHLSIRRNLLVDLEGLCMWITHLYLSENKRLVENWDPNQFYLSQLVNLQAIDLSKNSISNLSPGTFRPLVDLQEVYFGNNNLSVLPMDIFINNKKLEYIDLQFNHIQELKISLFAHLNSLKYLNVENNQILYLDKDFTDWIQNSGVFESFSLLDNPLSCQCNQDHVQQFIRTTNKVPDAHDLVCSGPTARLRGQKVFDLKRNTFYCDYLEKVIIAASVLGGFLITLIVALPCYKYRWYFTHARMVVVALRNQMKQVKFQQCCMYDATVIYDSDSEEDCDFLVETLCPQVEENSLSDSDEKVGYNLSTYLRDSLWSFMNITHSVAQKKTLFRVITSVASSFNNKGQLLYATAGR